MAQLPRIYAHLADQDHPILTRAMAQALATATDDDRLVMLDLILAQGSADDLGHVIGIFHELDTPNQQRLIDQIAIFEHAMRNFARQTVAQTRLNAIAMIREAGHAHFAYLLPQHLLSDEIQVKSEAAQVLRQLARPAFAHGHRWTVPDQPEDWAKMKKKLYDRRLEQRRIVDALHEATQSFARHQQVAIIGAICEAAAARPQGVGSIVSQLRHPAHRALATALEHENDVSIQKSALIFAAWEHLDNAVLAGLKSAKLLDRFDHLLSPRYMLEHPLVRRLIRRATQGRWVIPTATHLTGSSTRTHATWVRWIDALNLKKDKREEALSIVSGSEDRTTRLLALRALMEQPIESAGPTLASYCYDSELPLARMALRHLIAHRWSNLRHLLIRLSQRGHAELQRIAQPHMVPIGFQRLWQLWDSLNDAGRSSMGRAMLRIDPKFHRELANRLTAHDPEHRLRALMIVRYLNQESYFEDVLLNLVWDPEPKVASAAVRAVSGLGESDRVVKLLRKAVYHENDRVAANAIDTIRESDAIWQLSDTLIEFAKGERGAHRSRASAVRALMDLPTRDGVTALIGMLRSNQTDQQIAALWLVEQMQLMGLASYVAAIAKSPSEKSVKTRAEHVLRELIRNAKAQHTPRARGA